MAIIGFGLVIFEGSSTGPPTEAIAAEMKQIGLYMSLFGGLVFPPSGGGINNPSPLPTPVPETKPTPLPAPGYPALRRVLPQNVPLVSEKPWQHKPVFSVWMALSHDHSVPPLINPPEESTLSVIGKRAAEYAVQGAKLLGEGAIYAKNAIVRSWEWTWDLTASGFNYLSDKTRAALANCGAWFRESGKWIANEIIDPVTKKLSYTIHWVSEKTGEIIQLTETKIKGAWETVCKYTDITLEALKEIDWYQIASDLGNGTVSLMVKIGETIETFIVAIAVAAAVILVAGVIIWASAVGGGLATAIWATLTAATAGFTALRAATS